MLDVSLFGIDPGWAHVHNAILHGLNSLLVLMFLLRITQSKLKAALFSLIFLAHPQHVESVAWIAERKDVLCAFFYLLGLILYDRYQSRPTLSGYMILMSLFVLASLSKPMAVTFPAVLVILDVFHYHKKRYFSDMVHMLKYRSAPIYIFNKIPMFILSFLVGGITIWAQNRGGAVASLEMLPYWDRLQLASIGYAIYLRQFLIPTDLAIFYPFDKIWQLKELILPFGVLACWVGFSCTLWRKYPLIIAGLCWYLITLLPVIGLMHVGLQSHADRYMYIPSIGILIALSYLVPSSTSRYRTMGVSLIAVFICYLSLICYWQIGYWEDRRTLFTRALNISGPHWRLHVQISEDFLDRGMPLEALEHGRKAIMLRSDSPLAFRQMGNIYMKMNNLKTAESYYLRAINLGSSAAILYNNLGVALGRQNKTKDAVIAFNIALGIQPNLYTAKINLERYDHGGEYNTAKPEITAE
ncbi:MAG: hypothetical protein V7696_06015 [Halioglobus sp.]